MERSSVARLALISLVVLLSPKITEAAEPAGVDAGRGGNLPSARDSAPDFVPFPPASIETRSPNGRYSLIIQSPDEWKSKHAVARLFREERSGPPRTLWQKILPQEYGPRFALVGNRGQVVVFDEWSNIRSRYAIVLINPGKRPDIKHDFDAVARVLGAPVSTITEHASSGWWIAGKPVLDQTATAAVVSAAGKCLRIDLDTGRLSLQRDSTKGRAGR